MSRYKDIDKTDSLESRKVSFSEDQDNKENRSDSSLALEDALKERSIRESFLKASKLSMQEILAEEDSEDVEKEDPGTTVFASEKNDSNSDPKGHEVIDESNKIPDKSSSEVEDTVNLGNASWEEPGDEGNIIPQEGDEPLTKDVGSRESNKTGFRDSRKSSTKSRQSSHEEVKGNLASDDDTLSGNGAVQEEEIAQEEEVQEEEKIQEEEEKLQEEEKVNDQQPSLGSVSSEVADDRVSLKRSSKELARSGSQSKERLKSGSEIEVDNNNGTADDAVSLDSSRKSKFSSSGSVEKHSSKAASVSLKRSSKELARSGSQSKERLKSGSEIEVDNNNGTADDAVSLDSSRKSKFSSSGSVEKHSSKAASKRSSKTSSHADVTHVTTSEHDPKSDTSGAKKFESEDISKRDVHSATPQRASELNPSITLPDSPPLLVEPPPIASDGILESDRSTATLANLDEEEFDRSESKENKRRARRYVRERREVSTVDALKQPIPLQQLTSSEMLNVMSGEHKIVQGGSSQKSYTNVAKVDRQVLDVIDGIPGGQRSSRNTTTSVAPTGQRSRASSGGQLQIQVVPRSTVTEDTDFPGSASSSSVVDDIPAPPPSVKRRTIDGIDVPRFVDMTEDVTRRRHTSYGPGEHLDVQQEDTGNRIWNNNLETPLTSGADVNWDQSRRLTESKTLDRKENFFRIPNSELSTPSARQSINDGGSARSDLIHNQADSRADPGVDHEEDKLEEMARIFLKNLVDGAVKQEAILIQQMQRRSKNFEEKRLTDTEKKSAAWIPSPFSDVATIDTRTQPSMSSVQESFVSEVLSEFSVDSPLQTQRRRKKKRMKKMRKLRASDTEDSSPPSTDIARRRTDTALQKRDPVEMEKKYSLDQKLKAIEGIGNKHWESVEALADFMAPLVGSDDDLMSNLDAYRFSSNEPLGEKLGKHAVRITEPKNFKRLVENEEEKEEEEGETPHRTLKETQEILISQLTQPQLESFEFLFSKINRPYWGNIDWKKLCNAFEEYCPRTVMGERDAAIIVDDLDLNRSGKIEFDDFIALMTRPHNFQKILLRQDRLYLEAELKIWEDFTSKKYKFRTVRQIGSRSMRCQSLFLQLVRSIIIQYTLREIRIFYFNVITKLNDLAVESVIKEKHKQMIVIENFLKNQRLIDFETERQHRELLKKFIENLPPDRIARKETLMFRRSLKRRYPQMPEFQLSLRAGAEGSESDHGELVINRMMSRSQDRSSATSRRSYQRGGSASGRKSPRSMIFSYQDPQDGEYPPFISLHQINPTKIDYVIDIRQQAAQTKEGYYNYLRKTATANAKNLSNQIKFDYQRRRYTQKEEYGPVPKQFRIATTGSVLPNTRWRPKPPIKPGKPKMAWV